MNRRKIWIILLKYLPSFSSWSSQKSIKAINRTWKLLNTLWKNGCILGPHYQGLKLFFRLQQAKRTTYFQKITITLEQHTAATIYMRPPKFFPQVVSWKHNTFSKNGYQLGPHRTLSQFFFDVKLGMHTAATIWARLSLKRSQGQKRSQVSWHEKKKKSKKKTIPPPPMFNKKGEEGFLFFTIKVSKLNPNTNKITMQSSTHQSWSSSDEETMR